MKTKMYNAPKRLAATAVILLVICATGARATAEDCPQDDIERVITDLGMQVGQTPPGKLPRKISLWKLRKGLGEVEGTHMVHWRKDAAWDFPSAPQWAFSYFDGRKTRKLVFTAAGDHLDCLEDVVLRLFGELNGIEDGTLRNRIATVQMRLEIGADAEGKKLELEKQVNSIALSGEFGKTLIELAIYDDLSDAQGTTIKTGETLLAIEVTK